MAEPALRAHEIGDGQLTLGLVGQMVFALDHLEQRPDAGFDRKPGDPGQVLGRVAPAARARRAGTATTQGAGYRSIKLVKIQLDFSG
ncbi:hypothetical protein D7X33_13485 [Butyricicoccus sp. 1XD8-22]|nr:hypothetical protein D7X33_13485 [Butyricicoccus sp. 1XD8-22]